MIKKQRVRERERKRKRVSKENARKSESDLRER
jgi:hypothetical protein